MPPKLLYVVTEDWYFLSHRLAIARAACAAGFEIHVATKVTDGAAAIQVEGFVLHPMPFARGKLSPIAALATVKALRRVHCAIAPAICHQVSIEAIVLGSAAALGRTVACVNSFTGLGYSFDSRTAKARALRPFVTALLRGLTIGPRCVAVVQNPAHRDEIAALGVTADKIALIPGSGVDVDQLQPLPEPSGPVTVGFVGRLLDDKGIRTLIQAHCLLRDEGSEIELLIAGTPDPANPTSISEQEAETWNNRPGIRWLGHVKDIAALWVRAHIAVLPSRHEGLPKSLLEAAACGRPMVATDIPGCRQIVRPGETGLVVPVDDPAALAAAIKTLAASAGLRSQYGAAARALVVERFSSAVIGRQTVDLYRSLVTLEPRG